MQGRRTRGRSPEGSAAEEASAACREAGSPPGSIGATPAAGASARGGVFVGREGALREVARLLAHERVVTLLGPTGIGKSRLALECSYKGKKGQVLVVDAGEVRSVRSLAATMARALRIGGGAARRAGGNLKEAEPERIGRALSRRGGVLVILDGAEGIGPEAGALFDTWFGAAPRARFLLTSLRRPGLVVERCWELPPLTVDEAVELYLERALRLGADAGLAADRSILVELVERLGCNPLALEQAASRARVLRPRQILARLDRGLELSGTAREGRHASMGTAIRWMWSWLEPAEVELVARCSVFAGGFTPEAAEAVLGAANGDVLDALAALRDRSFLRFDGGRFEVPEPLRAHGLRALASLGPALEGDAQSRHAAWCAGLVSELPGDEEGLALAAKERANLFAAHRYGIENEPLLGARVALALARVLATHGPPGEEARILDTGIEAARSAGDRLLLARLLRGRAMLSMRLGALEEARLDLEACETIGRAEGDRAIEIQAGVEQGRLRFSAGDFDLAQVMLARGIEQLAALEVAAHPAARFLQGYAQNLLGMVREAQGRLEESAGCFEAALAIFRRVGNRRYVALASMNLGVVRFAVCHLDEATQLFEQAVAGFRELGDRAGEADSIVNLGCVLVSAGRLGEAERLLQKGLELEQALGNRRAEALVLGNLGVVAFERGDLRTAEERLRGAVDTARRAGEKNFHALYLAFHGAVTASLGDRGRAVSDFETARSWFAGVGDPGHLATVQVLESFLHLEVEAERCARLDAARAILEAGGSTGRSTGVRLALRLLERAIRQRRGDAVRRWVAPEATLVSGGALEIGADAGWFRLGERTADLGRKAKPRRLLRVLIERRLSAPGVGIPAEQLAEAGWPDDRAPADVVANRVYVAINTLRAMGLESVLLRRDDGYLLAPSLPVRRLD